MTLLVFEFFKRIDLKSSLTIKKEKEKGRRGEQKDKQERGGEGGKSKEGERRESQKEEERKGEMRKGEDIRIRR